MIALLHRPFGDLLVDLQRLPVLSHFVFGHNAGVADDLLLHPLDEVVDLTLARFDRAIDLDVDRGSVGLADAGGLGGNEP